MVNASELGKIQEALDGGDWMVQVEAVDLAVELMGKPGAIGEAEADLLIERFCDSGMKWEVKLRLAKAAHKLSQERAALVIARLKDDPSFDVRQAVRKALRRLNQASFMKEEQPRLPAVADLARKLSRSGVPDADRLVREVEHATRSHTTAELSHELKNILQRILTPTNQLVKAMTAEQRKVVEAPLAGLRKGTKALEDFAKGIEWLAHGRNLEFVKTDVQDLVRDVADSVKPIRGVSVLTPSRQEAKLDCVPERLTRALANILRNAVEATPSKTVVVLDAFLTETGDEVEFRITDQGPGIPEDERDYWFKIGKTSKREKGHIGIGLYIARQVIEFEHGGTITVDNAPKKGAIFRVRVPLKAPAKRQYSSENER